MRSQEPDNLGEEPAPFPPTTCRCLGRAGRSPKPKPTHPTITGPSDLRGVFLDLDAPACQAPSSQEGVMTVAKGRAGEKDGPVESMEPKLRRVWEAGPTPPRGCQLPLELQEPQACSL